MEFPPRPIRSIDVYRRATIASRKAKNFFPPKNRVFGRVIVPSLSTWLTGIIGQGGASGGARSSDVKLIGKSVTRPRRSSSRFGKREDPVILEDEEGGEVTTRMMK